jgi:hypothetical protein
MKKLKCCLQRQRSIITVATKTNETAQAGFVVSQIIAKKSKPLTYGEYVKECIMKAT